MRVEQFGSSEVNEVTIVLHSDFEAVRVVTCSVRFLEAPVVYTELKLEGGGVGKLVPRLYSGQGVQEVSNWFLFNLVDLHFCSFNISVAYIVKHERHDVLHFVNWLLQHFCYIDISRRIRQWPNISVFDKEIHILLIFFNPSNHLRDTFKPLGLDQIGIIICFFKCHSISFFI